MPQSIEQRIITYRKSYKVFVVLMLIGLIDSVVIPILFKSMGTDLKETGLIPIFFIRLGWTTVGVIAVSFELLWFVWGLIAVIANRKASNLEKKLKSETKI